MAKEESWSQGIEGEVIIASEIGNEKLNYISFTTDS